MKSLLKKIIDFKNKILDFYRGKSTKEIFALNALLLLGFLWPLMACIIYVVLVFYKSAKYKVFGRMAMIGALVNYILYFLQILLNIMNTI